MLVLAASAMIVVRGQQTDDGFIPPPPPTRPRPPEDEDKGVDAAAASTRPLVEQDAPWILPQDTRSSLAHQADLYREYALRFTSVETVVTASYDSTGEAGDESARRYAYLLERSSDGATLREFRQKAREDGTPKGGEIKDEEPFPPAYGWVDLFSGFNQPYFQYRDLGDRFDGFDWVREIQFRGKLGFTDGRDIRQWEGTVLVDAVTHAPIEIRAEPSGQQERIAALFARWNQGFNLLGFRLAPRPYLYRCGVQFRLRKDGLNFPTELRYDTLIAVSSKQVVPYKSSSRRYDDYRFFKTATIETPGKPVR
jgi:hypothetical protein